MLSSPRAVRLSKKRLTKILTVAIIVLEEIGTFLRYAHIVLIRNSNSHTLCVFGIPRNIIRTYYTTNRILENLVIFSSNYDR